MDNSNSTKIYWKFILSLAGLKMLIHIFTNAITDFGLHRDEYLYISESDHLDWGYMEVPPMISIIGKVARVLFGDNMFAVRFFPALVGAITIVLLGIMIRDLGGKKKAQIIGCSGFLLSLAFLGSNNLFQPVSFNQFWWFVAAFVMVKIVKKFSNALNNETDKTNHYRNLWIALGLVGGLGFLTKYSIVFFLAALIGALIISPYRKILLTRFPYLALGIALVIALPNLWWQYSHDFPIVKHMEELSSSQLVNVRSIDFFVPQFLDHFGSTLIWLPGLIFGLYHPKVKPYRFLSVTFLIVIFLIWSMSGKDYYTFGAYAMMFALGGVAWEHWMGHKSWVIVPIILILNIPMFPMAIPILPVKQMQNYSLYLQNNLGLSAPFRWEDGIVRNLRQDYADMQGWEEIPQKVAKVYNNLSPELQSKCLITGGHYGQAGVLNFYRKKYNLPEAYSFNASFVAWVPEDLEFEVQIQVDDTKQYSSAYFDSVVLMDSIENPYARDPGLIYLKSKPKMELKSVWKEMVREQKAASGY